METSSRSPTDVDFPLALLDLRKRGLSPCTWLRTRGPWPAPPGIAIVGTRRPDEASVAFARTLAAEVADTGLAVWSGGAIGIDRAAHEGAMERGGRTVVVSPSGLDNPYPKEHRSLFEGVLATGGTIVSPFPDDAPPIIGAFHRRNAVLAALTIATVVVQAGEKSGARATAHAARKLERPVYVVPHAPWHESGRGCALELVDGAQAIVSSSTLLARLNDELNRWETRRSVMSARELQLIGTASSCSDRSVGAPSPSGGPSREHARTRTLHELDAIAKRVIDAIGEVPIHMDDLCERTALSAGAVTAALLTLTLGAVVVEAPAGYYRLSTI